MWLASGDIPGSSNSEPYYMKPPVPIHILKTWPPYFCDIVSGIKTFEIRKDDRGFNVGDILKLLEYDNASGKYSNRRLYRQISYKMDGGQFGIESGYCVLGLSLLSPAMVNEMLEICGRCGGSGTVDSGGQNPDGSWINIPCPDCQKQQTNGGAS